jgi:uncharacterized Ntn-hydrolase superfamily protein
MTWSILAIDDSTGRIGIAVATRFFAVGARVPHIRSGVGAVATQALINQSYGPLGLDLLASGAAPDAALSAMVTKDPAHEHRQVHLMNAKGESAAYTGAACVNWCGRVAARNLSVAGNMLTGEEVITATADAFIAHADLPFARRLLVAMMAGEAAGGDKRGKQSAALLVHDAGTAPIYDLRVDDHPDPLSELSRLHAVSLTRYIHFRRAQAQLEGEGQPFDRTRLEQMIAQSIAEGFE